MKSNALEVQRLVVLWLFAIYCWSYPTSLKLKLIKQQIMAIGPLLGLLPNCQAAAEEFPVDLNDVAKQVKAAAGMFIDLPWVK